MIRKKGQLKIQEMAFVLLAVVFLFALVFLFFIQFQTRALSEQARMIREERTLALLDYVSAMPELGCSGLEEIICIDKSKATAFNESSKIQNNYEKLWQGANILRISVKEMYPGSTEYLIYESDEIVTGSAETYSTFIPLCEAAIGGTQCVIGRILITTEMPVA